MSHQFIDGTFVEFVKLLIRETIEERDLGRLVRMTSDPKVIVPCEMHVCSHEGALLKMIRDWHSR